MLETCTLSGSSHYCMRVCNCQRLLYVCGTPLLRESVHIGQIQSYVHSLYSSTSIHYSSLLYFVLADQRVYQCYTVVYAVSVSRLS